MLKVRIAVLVSGNGTNLQALIDAQISKIIKSGEIALVLSSNSEAYALTRADKAGIPKAIVSRNSCASDTEFEARLESYLKEYGAELIVLAGFMSILSADFVDRWPRRIINVHPSLIPSFCGSGYYGIKVHEAALGKGVKVTGATVHYVNEIPDGGEIILQKSLAVYKGDTAETLQKRVMEKAEWKLLPRAVEMVSADILKRRKQHGV